MPYIKDAVKRLKLKAYVRGIVGKPDLLTPISERPISAGELNYCICMAFLMLRHTGAQKNAIRKIIENFDKSDYQKANDAVGALVMATREIQSRWGKCLTNWAVGLICDWYAKDMVPYEDKKIEENGDVY